MLSVLPLLLLMVMADGITVHVTYAISGSTVLTVHKRIDVSALKDMILAQDPKLERPGIKLFLDTDVTTELQDVDEIIESANVLIVISAKILNKCQNAWVWLSSGKVTCAGHEWYGGRAPEGLENVKEVVATYYSFAALKSDGSVTVWGCGIGGAPEDLENVEEVVATCSAFAARKSDGSVTVWGHSPDGTAPKGLENVKEVVATNFAFAALKKDNSVIAWGLEEYGGKPPEGLDNVKKVVATKSAFAALKFDGSILVWPHSQENKDQACLLLKAE